MTNGWTITEASSPDFETLSVIHGACFARRWSANELRSLSTESVATPLMAMVDESIVGFILPRVAAGEAEILTIAVEPPYQAMGAGGFLLDAAIKWAVRMGAKEMFLEVDEDNGSALRLYQRAGFKAAGRRPGYFEATSGGHSSAKSALVMRLEMGK